LFYRTVKHFLLQCDLDLNISHHDFSQLSWGRTSSTRVGSLITYTVGVPSSHPQTRNPPWVVRAVLAGARCPSLITSFCPLPSKHLGKPATARQVVNPNGRGAVTLLWGRCMFEPSATAPNCP
jgi:hypothetical protein